MSGTAKSHTKILAVPLKRPASAWLYMAIATAIVFMNWGHSFVRVSLGFLCYLIYRWYVAEREKIRRPALEHRKKYRKWYEEQDAIRARYQAQKRRRLWI